MFGRILRLITNRWVLAFIGFVALGVLVWFAGPLIAIADFKPLDSAWARAAVILALPLSWLLTQFRIRFIDKRAEAKLAESLSEDAERPAAADGTAAVATDPEQVVLAERLKNALETLQSAKLAKGRKLYQLPWYVIIGAPGSGKTTALKNSGLHFPLQSELGEDPVQGAGGTRYCDWWFTDEAVFIDTAGRYTMQDNPGDAASQAWLGFLSMLKRSRPRRPLNGIVVTISILDLLQKTPTQQAMQATAIRRRIQELNGHLGMELPVYVVFTKCDLVAGFNEFFLDLKAEDRDQVWGMTWPYAKGDAASVGLAAFSASFEELIGRASDRVTPRLHEEGSARQRMLIFEFPRQMLSLQEKLQALLRDIFMPNQFEQPAILRGVYFVSATQTASAASWAAGVLPPALCMPPLSTASTAPPRSFFISGLLRDVIFAEADLAAANRQMQHRFRWAYGGALAVVGAAFIVSVVAWLSSYGANRSYLDRVEDRLEAYRAHQHSAAAEHQIDWTQLAAALDRLQALQADSGHVDAIRPERMGFGLDQSGKIRAQARSVYLGVLERRFLPAVTAQLLQQLELASEREDYLYEALRVYLMFYQREHMEPEAVRTWLGVLWDRALPGMHHDSTRRALDKHLAVALEAGLLPPPMDDERVAAGREILLATPLDRRLYARLKSDYLAQQRRGFNVVEVLGQRDAEALFTRRSRRPLSEGIPSYFTYQGFHRGFNLQKRRLKEILEQEHWVYASDNGEIMGDAELEALSQALDGHYAREYIATWQAYLGDLQLNPARSSRRAVDAVQTLASGSAPIIQVLEAVQRQTALNELPEGSGIALQVADQLSDSALPNQRRRLEQLIPEGLSRSRIKLPGQEVADAFQALNRFVAENDGAALERLQASLQGFSEHFEQLANAREQRRVAFSAALDPQRNAAGVLELERALASAPAVVRQWFEPLTGASRHLTATGARNFVNDAWRSDVLSFYERAIANRYPIDAQASREISIEDFTMFFGPDGILDDFFRTHIEPFVDRRQSTWRWRRSIGISHRALRTFQSAARIRETYFIGPGQPQVEFALRPHSLDSAVVQALLEIGAAQVSYQHGPVRTTPMQWQFEGADRSRLVLSLANRSTPLSTIEEGQWSLFRLIEKHAIQQPLEDSDDLLLRFVINGITAEYILQPPRAANPFDHADLRGFTLPRNL